MEKQITNNWARRFSARTATLALFLNQNESIRRFTLDISRLYHANFLDLVFYTEFNLIVLSLFLFRVLEARARRALHHKPYDPTFVDRYVHLIAHNRPAFGHSHYLYRF